MQKILIALSTLGDGGIASMMKQYVLNIDRSSFHIDFLAYEGQNLSNCAFFEEQGCSVFVVPDPKRHYFSARKQIVSLLRKENYDVLHSCNFFNSGFLMKFAKEAGIKGRLVHSHASHSYGAGIVYRIYEKWMRSWIMKYGNCFLACSSKAGDYLFGSRTYKVLPNAVDAKRFSYDPKQRRTIRNTYGISEDTIVIGTVAMISSVKNHVFLTEVLKELPENYHFLLVGDGDQRELLEQKAKENGVFDRMTITGWTKEAYRYYSAFDRFVLPSFSEGFPVVSLEAQANGLPCYLSNTITGEVKVSEQVVYLPLSNAKQWADALKTPFCEERKNVLLQTQFDMSVNIHLLEDIYRRAGSAE